MPGGGTPFERKRKAATANVLSEYDLDHQYNMALANRMRNGNVANANTALYGMRTTWPIP